MARRSGVDRDYRPLLEFKCPECAAINKIRRRGRCRCGAYFLRSAQRSPLMDRETAMRTWLTTDDGLTWITAWDLYQRQHGRSE